MLTSILCFNHWQSVIVDRHQAVWPVSAFSAVPAMFAQSERARFWFWVWFVLLPDNAEMLIVLKVEMLLCNSKKLNKKLDMKQ